MKNRTEIVSTKRCAIYTRKSHELDLEQDFNTLDAQRDAGESYVASQKANGWVCLAERYDDGGYSGGNLNRPALQRLKEDIEAGKVDIVVVYKLDRLTRSLMDFSDLQEFFDAHNVSFVSVTQEINTSTSAGRMMMNILMTFAQYEREIIAERVRDKIAAAKKRGKHCGGYPVLGYDSDPSSHRLVINPKEAEIVKFVFNRYIQVGSASRVAAELELQGCRGKIWTTRGGVKHNGQKMDNQMIYRMLNNQLYIGRVTHLGQSYPGEHEAIIDRKTWDLAQELLKSNLSWRTNFRNPRFQPFNGLLKCGHCNTAITLSHTVKHGKVHYRYYLCNEDTKRNFKICPNPRIPAAEFERTVLTEITKVLNTPTMLAKIDQRLAVKGTDASLRQLMVKNAIGNLNNLWEILVPVERYKIIHGIVRQITVYRDHMRIEFNKEGIMKLMYELGMEESHE